MIITVEQLESWMADKEDENMEFKEAKTNFHFEELLKYCTALANEGGGKIIFGVSDRRPRKVVGTQAFEQPERTRAGIMQKLPLRVNFDIVEHKNGRVLIFTIPSRPVGMPLQTKGIYWERHGDSVRAMSQDKLKAIFDESGHDFSADPCPGASWNDLETNSIEAFRKKWIAKSRNAYLEKLPPKQLLRDAEAITDQGITYAALILFGTRQALGKYLAQAEVVFEYRFSEAAGPG